MQDIVILATCILAEDCNTLEEHGRGRVDDATLSRLIMKDNMVYIEADGFIGGVQMTLSHSSDFSIELTDKTLQGIADYRTNGHETTLIIVNPISDELFMANGDYEIVNLIVANSKEEVNVIVSPQSYKLGLAYPNPFNPTMGMELTLTEKSQVQVSV